MPSDVTVKFEASLQGLITGFEQARAAVTTFTNQVKESVAGLTAPFEQLNRAILAVAAVAAGGAVFKDIIDSTNNAALEVNKLSRSMGMSLEDASVWRTALIGVGISTEDFRHAAFMLDRQIRTNSETVQQAGVVIKDSNGNLLGQTQLMQNAIAALGQYKEGTDRTIAAQTLFGRGAQDVNSFLRLNSAAFERAAKDVQELGLAITPEDVSRSRQYRLAMNELSLSFEGIKKAIGDQLLPYLTAFANWFRSVAPTAIATMNDKVQTAVLFMTDLVGSIGNVVLTLEAKIADISGGLERLVGRLGAAAALAKTLALDANPLAWIRGVDDFLIRMHELDKPVSGEIERSRIALDEQRKAWDATVASWRKTLEDLGHASSPGSEGGPGTRSANDLLSQGSGAADAITKAQKEIDGQIKVLQRGLEEKRAIYEADAAIFGMSEDKKFALTQKATEGEYQAEIALLEKKRAIRGLEPSQIQEVDNKIAELRAKHRTTMLQLDVQSIQSMAQKWQEALSTLTNSFNSQLRGLLGHTTTFAQAFRAMVGDVLMSLINAVEQMAVKWAAMELAKTTATTSGAAARAGAETAGQASGWASTLMNALRSIGASLGMTFAGVSANQAPLIGPAAPAEAAAVTAAVDAAAMGFIPHYDVGAWRVNRTGLAVVHEGEFIPPAGASDFARQAFANAASGAGTSGGDTHVHLNFPGVTDAAGFKRMVKDHVDHIAREVGRHVTYNRSARATF
jgi:hypothetical protein